MRIAVALLVLVGTLVAAGAAPRPVRVGDALCVAWSGPPLLALPDDVRDAYLAALGDAGWRLLRTDFTWSAIEPSPGQRDFGRYDALVAQAKRHRIRLLGLLDYGNPWASPSAPAGDDRYPPDDPAAFADFAAAAARRYRGRVPAWEVWNEPNNGLSGFWKPSPDAGAYARLAVAAARAIRRADRRATVVTGGLAPTLDFLSYGGDWGFVTAADAAVPRWLASFDAAAFHPYSFLQAPAPETDSGPAGPTLVQQIADFRARVNATHVFGVAPWVTELGWHTAADSGTPGFPPGVSEEDQARYLVRAWTLALAAGVERVCWYTATDYANADHDKEAAFGLFRYQTAADPLQPKPAFAAARVFAQLLGRTRYSRDLRAVFHLPDDAWALCFVKGRQQVIVLWSTRPQGGQLDTTLNHHARKARVVAMDGSATRLDPRQPLSLVLGPSPVYLIVN
jgi:hypothetical protein